MVGVLSSAGGHKAGIQELGCPWEPPVSLSLGPVPLLANPDSWCEREVIVFFWPPFSCLHNGSSIPPKLGRRIQQNACKNLQERNDGRDLESWVKF